MKILTVLTYYRPHTSGLTIYVERLAQALVRQGQDVTVLTSRFQPDLPTHETRNGVEIHRAPVLFRISKGVIMPTLGFLAWRLIREHDVVHLHLPQFDAAGIGLLGRLLGKPVVITYHCDLELPRGPFNWFVNQIVHIMNHLAGLLATRIGAYTEDFASHSPYLQRFEKKVRVILPPVELPEVSRDAAAQFYTTNNPREKKPLIGMATRFASEKGVEILLEALPRVLEAYPDAMVWYAGQYRDVMGEEAYYERLIPKIRQYEKNGQWHFLGILSPEQMSAFYPHLDALVVPSLNSTETFGLVQIEAMIKGTPTVAANLPGVRQPPRITGMGKVVPIGDSTALAEALVEIFTYPERFRGDPSAVARQFAPRNNAAAYLDLYRSLINS
jgi:glycosyltransferase involved in cell wall biosynthesis